MIILILVLGCYTEPHPIYVADGIYQHFCLGMDYWPWYKELLLWLSWVSGPLSPLCWSVQHLCCDQWCYSGQIWERGPFDVPWISLQRSLRTLLYIPHRIPPYHIYSCRWPHIFHHWIQVLGGHQEVLNCCASSKVHLYPIVFASLFDTFTQSPVIWHSYVRSRGDVLLSGSCSVFVSVGCAVHLDFHSI